MSDFSVADVVMTRYTSAVGRWTGKERWKSPCFWPSPSINQSI